MHVLPIGATREFESKRSLSGAASPHPNTKKTAQSPDTDDASSTDSSVVRVRRIFHQRHSSAHGTYVNVGGSWWADAERKGG